MWRVAVALLLSAVACSRGSDRSGGTADSVVVQAVERARSPVYSVPSRPDSAPPEERLPALTFPEPALVLAADSGAGQQLYRTSGSCAPCHGLRLEGVTGLGSALADSTWEGGDGSLTHLFAVIRDGVPAPVHTRTPMPAQVALHTPREIFQMAAFVFSASRRGVTVRDSSALTDGSPPLVSFPRDTSSLR